MLDFFLDLKLWQLTFVVLGISLAFGLVFSVGIRKIFKLNPTAQQADLAIDLMQVTSTYIGILLAFAGVLPGRTSRTPTTPSNRKPVWRPCSIATLLPTARKWIPPAAT
jgi:hypothetical protein